MPQAVDEHAAFYNRIAHLYDAIADSGEAEARSRGEQALALQPGEQVLELGFGTGNSVRELAKKVGPDGRVTGVDIAAEMKQVAEKKLADEPELASRIALRVGDARKLSFEAECFDAVFASFTLELFDEGEIPVVLAEIWRVLRPSGRVAVVTMTVPDDPQHASLLEKTYIWMHRHFPHIVDCRPIEPVRLLDAAGFEVTHSEQLEIWTLPVSVVVGRKLGRAGSGRGRY